jgi:type VI protein secretion system component Hcp
VDLTGFCFSGRAPSAGGPATFSSFTIAKQYDRSTPELLSRMVTGAPVATPAVDVVRTGTKGPEQVMRFKFDGFQVDGYRQGAHGDPLGEDVALSWGAVTLAAGKQTFQYTAGKGGG